MKHFLTFLSVVLLPLACVGAPSYTTYFNNTHTYTNAAVAGAATVGSLVSTNGVTSQDLTASRASFTDSNKKLVSTGTSAALSGALSDETGSGVAVFGTSPTITDGLTLTNTTAAIGAITINQFTGATNAAISVNTAGTSQFKLYGEAANTLALRNGPNAQLIRWYHSFTDASNYQRGVLSTSSSAVVLSAESAGTGAGNIDITLTPKGSGVVRVGTVVSTSGYDAAATGYFDWSGRSVIRSPANGRITLYNTAENDFSLLQFGGTSSSFPALKRSSTEIQARLADDSADAPLKSGQLSNTGIRVMTPSSLQTLAAGNALLANATKVRVVGSGGAVTLTSTPTIADGSDGQYVMIQGTDDTNTLTVQDQGSLASSNLELGAATRVLGAGDVLVLTFDTTASVWYEVSFANN